MRKEEWLLLVLLMLLLVNEQLEMLLGGKGRGNKYGIEEWFLGCWNWNWKGYARGLSEITAVLTLNMRNFYYVYF